MKVESYFQQEFKTTQESLKTQGIGEIWALAPINDNKIITGAEFRRGKNAAHIYSITFNKASSEERFVIFI